MKTSNSMCFCGYKPLMLPMQNFTVAAEIHCLCDYFFYASDKQMMLRVFSCMLSSLVSSTPFPPRPKMPLTYVVYICCEATAWPSG